MLFQPLKSGQKINRQFFNDLISFCNSLVLRGDGKTTQVTHTAGGTTVSAVIPEGRVDDRQMPFAVSITGGICTVAPGRLLVWRMRDGAIVSGGGFTGSLPTRSFALPPADGTWYLHMLSTGILVWSPNQFFGIAGCPAVMIAEITIAAGVVTDINRRIFGDAHIIDLDHPWRISGVMRTDGSITNGLVIDNAGDLCDTYRVRHGWKTVATPYGGTSQPPKDGWSRRQSTDLSSADLAGGAMIYFDTVSGVGYKSGSNVSVFSGPVWDADSGAACIPIGFVDPGEGVIEQIVTSAIYAVPLYQPA